MSFPDRPIRPDAQPMRPDDHGGDLASHPDIRLDFSVNVNPLSVPARVIEALIDDLVRAGEGGGGDGSNGLVGCELSGLAGGPFEPSPCSASSIARYPDPQCRELRHALAGHHGVHPSQVVCGNGACDLIHRAVVAANPRRVLIPVPTFTEYERSARFCGAEVTRHPLDPPLFDPAESLLSAITPGIDLVFCCNPNNPTGRLVDPALLRRLVERTRAAGAVLVVDECFLPFTDAPSLIPGIESHVVVLRAFTKTHALPGLRLGYAVCGDGRLAAAMADQPPRWNVSGPAQAAGLAALACSGYEERTKSVVAAERTYLTEALTQLGLDVVPSHANFILFRCETDLFRPLTDQGILIRSCANFPGLDPSYWRVGLHRHADNVILVDALRKVLNDC